MFLLGLGTIMAIGPTVAQHFGAGRRREIGYETRQGFWLGLGITGLIVIAMRSVEPLLLAMRIDAAVSLLAQGYLEALSWGVLAAYAYHTLKQMSEGVGRTVPIMVVMAVALPINIALNYTFMFGRFGAPALGAVGCGLGNGISFWIMFLMRGLYTLRSRHYRSFALWQTWNWPDFGAITRLLMLGLPIGLSLFLQSGLFTTVALMMGALGTFAVAAHQIVLNYSGLVFMVPLGLGMALTGLRWPRSWTSRCSQRDPHRLYGHRIVRLASVDIGAHDVLFRRGDHGGVHQRSGDRGAVCAIVSRRCFSAAGRWFPGRGSIWRCVVSKIRAYRWC